ncbi:reverse transcriptase domain-containing protein [Tanacetum coccineum]|uniref:Reverse transcriptase domain-containing protein n=1 Tax=Tanacetum coccineum TaxID=301880 RepID=A0ABQ5E1U9_9ASTR
MPRFAPTIKNLLMNKEKLFELAKILLNENCSAMLLKKLPKKLGDPDKFLIPYNFSGMDVCHALADLGASINLMPLSLWKKLSLPKLTPTRMTFELADRSITRPKGLAEDVFVKTDFVVVDFEADPRVPLIVGRSFLRTGRALIDVYGEEITLRVIDEAVNFNLDQTKRYSSTYDDMSINRINVIDVACEEYSQEVLGFSLSGNPTMTFEPIIFDTFLSFTLFKESDFILEEIEAFLKDDSISPEINHVDCDPEGDICLIEKLLNNDPFQLPPMDLKEVTKAKPSIEEPPELELKDLPSHLEYAYLEENDKLPVIIAKSLKDDEKEALLKVLKLHKRAIAWKITDIKGINPLFEFNDEYISSDVNPLFDEAIEDIKCKDSYDYNLDPSISVVSIFGGFTDEPPLEENDDLFDLECKTNYWKKILYDAPIDDMIFDPGGDIDEINAFLDDYKDSREDILEILHNTTYNLFPKVFFDHEP